MLDNLLVSRKTVSTGTNNNATTAGAYVWELPEKHQFDGPRRKSLEKSHFSFESDVCHELPVIPYKQHPINKRPLNPYGYPEWRYTRTNVDKRAASGSMYDILSHKWTHDWINVRRHASHRQSVEENQEYMTLFNRGAHCINRQAQPPCVHPEEDQALRQGEVYARQERIDPRLHTNEFHQKMLTASSEPCKTEPCNLSQQIEQCVNLNGSSGAWPIPGTENSNAASCPNGGPAFSPHTNTAYGFGYQQTDTSKSMQIPPNAQPYGSRTRRMWDDWMRPG